jgi:hypothetical protein
VVSKSERVRDVIIKVGRKGKVNIPDADIDYFDLVVARTGILLTFYSILLLFPYV